jgi:hypothetical protein
MLTGRWSPVKIKRTLHSPVAVLAMTSGGLRLDDGRVVQIPGVASVPLGSPALIEATASGVEVEPDGRLVGLVRVHHGCGNDPVRRHVARVDLARLVQFVHGDPQATTEELEERAQEFGALGWEVSGFLVFESWCRAMDSGDETPGEQAVDG